MYNQFEGNCSPSPPLPTQINSNDKVLDEIGGNLLLNWVFFFCFELVVFEWIQDGFETQQDNLNHEIWTDVDIGRVRCSYWVH